MKRKFISAFLILSLVVSSMFAKETIIQVFEKSKAEIKLFDCLRDGLEKLEIDLDSTIPSDRLSAINYILKNTFENNIHKMRGEEDNKVYTKATGEEAVFDAEGNLVTNDWNRGSYNYGTYEQPIGKFELDIWPWLVWGNSKNDPTSFDERFYYYIMDLDIGIQEYIFLKDKSKLEKIDYSRLDENDKLVYKFFEYLLFNDTYKYDLKEKNIRNYKKSAENYWKYLSQLLVLSGYDDN